MTEPRYTASTITDEALERLYEQRDRLGYEVQQWKATYGEHALRDTLARLHGAEAALERVQRACHDLPYEQARRVLAALEEAEESTTP